MDDLLLGPLGAQRDHPAEALAVASPLHLGAAGLILLLIAGCGESSTQTEAPSGLPSTGGGGALTYALDDLPATLDPLAAATRPAQIVTRQFHEPLVAKMNAPYEGARGVRGLALSVKPSANETVWKVTLRTGVRFQDGSPFNAAAVLANSRRWSSVPLGRGLLPGLFAVDAPRPTEVRFLFRRPMGDLPDLLSSPRLGLVSPQALAPQGGEGARFRRAASGSGTGPFQLEARSGSRLELARSAAWWGSPEGLGPALDAVRFVRAPTAAERVELLASGDAQVVEPLDGAGLRLVADDPLLDLERIDGTPVGLEASVRGLESPSVVPLLSGVWLTRIGG